MLSDIKCESRIDYFDLMDLDDGVDEYDEDGKKIKKHKKQLKSENARRQVVIHPVLIDLGFLDYVAELRARKGVRVFPHLTAYRGKLTHNWSKWWARFTDDYVTADPLKVFHSFRHKFIDRMRRLKVEPFVLKALVGHASSDTTDGYGDVCDLSTRRDAIYVLDYPGLDLSHLKRKGVM